MRRALPATLVVLACGGGSAPLRQAAAPVPQTPPVPAVVEAEPFLPPQIARLAGLLPTRSLGIEQFRLDHPEADGRGVLIAILDGGVDAGVPGLLTTTTGEPKLVDLRDFSGEGRIALQAVRFEGDSLLVAGRYLAGLGRVRALARGPFWVGTFDERPLGNAPAADVNGDGDADDRFPVLVARASDGWVMFTDTDGDGSLEGERPLRDYAVARDTFRYGPHTIAVNLHGESDEAPTLTLFFDTSGHGTHVAGIAAGHDLFGIAGFDGAAPGAQVLGLKIANNARGGISVTGSMWRAMTHAAAFAAGRRQPLVLNLSYGVGNEGEGSAVIDSLVNTFALAHPEVLLVISAGNDGPGLSTVGFPGSAEFALSVCALFPGVFAEPPRPGTRPRGDVMGWWSSRGGEVQKPDVCAPGVAYSTVPRWQTGEEVSGGTSMAAPQVSGAAALLQSALLSRGAAPARAVDVKAALMATARPVPGATVIDAGTGVPDIEEAFRWLVAGHQPGRFRIRALSESGGTRATAAYRRDGLRPADSILRFEVTSVAGQPTAEVVLAADVPWLRPPVRAAFHGGPVTIPVAVDRTRVREPGLYVGTVWARSATNPLAGALFGLTTTIVVPYDLGGAPVRWQRLVAAGKEARVFLRVPEGAGGLRVAARAQPGQEASIALFEPSGRPQRDGSVLELAAATPRGVLTVRAEDLVPGVWEVVVVAPPLSAANVTIEADVPAVRLEQQGEGIALVNPGDRPVTVNVSARSVGGAERYAVHGAGAPVTRQVTPPGWTTRLSVDVALDAVHWGWFTDFGVSVFDDEGRLLSTEPMNYATGRQTVDRRGGGPVGIELYPSFARADEAAEWTGTLTVGFQRPARPAPVLGGASDTTFVLEPHGRRELRPTAPGDLPASMRLLLEVEATVDGVTAVRRAAVPVVPLVPVEAGR